MKKKTKITRRYIEPGKDGIGHEVRGLKKIIYQEVDLPENFIDAHRTELIWACIGVVLFFIGYTLGHQSPTLRP